ncbi:[FeFe] hydrogenase H-cluster maturation GTPase HydF [candidate division KSB3 bacterium]|uniref:[FeFe] hydrogenase H-cluster maturation GTPase HydF n=1 Tax=candidate division KSB3 bacterium TaxID=2044937 RepID=A0A2G6K6J1_9BACT|nr:MAG: [FeFe] hydrogenase H-cluster maturation GTPase HydF [candidate division KSB3 bacterium]
MTKTPKSLRLQIGLFGRTNVGKSSFLNLVSGQDVALTSEQPGTTTDIVQKAMELLPLGPVTFLDTGGLDDTSVLGELRVQRTQKAFHRADISVLLTEAGIWGPFEEQVAEEARKHKVPLIAVINKIDQLQPQNGFFDHLKTITPNVLSLSCHQPEKREQYVNDFKKHVIAVCPDEFLNPPALIGDLLPSGGLAVLVVPIDLQAPKGRLILPQVQTIRDALDNDAATLIVKEREYAYMLSLLNRKPDVVVCDSQVVMKMVADTPEDVKCTTFSILFARYKGDLIENVRGAAALESLNPGDRVLIAEACSHHAMEDDIGRVKIPRWLRQYVGGDLAIDVCSGRDYPDNLTEYKTIVHCGGCMLTRREVLYRLHTARQTHVPVVNYGVCISLLQGVLERALSPFPAALHTYNSEKNRLRTACSRAN